MVWISSVDPNQLMIEDIWIHLVFLLQSLEDR